MYLELSSKDKTKQIEGSSKSVGYFIPFEMNLNSVYFGCSSLNAVCPGAQILRSLP